jgi:Salmonella virulence plasmid 28.1kDa A protein
MYDLSHLAAPAYTYSESDREEVTDLLQKQVSKRHNPNYSEIFGSPDICECEHCRSVYSAASYFVDLLRFLWRDETNADGKSPLEMFTNRRLNLLHLPLTCENTNTIIPYIDLVNEIMQYYTYHGYLEFLLSL